MSEIEGEFPRLRTSPYTITSPKDWTYNCIAWAAGMTDVPWWPDPNHDCYWPTDIPRERSLPCFSKAYRQLGYERCDSPAVESAFEKIAIFVDAEGEPTHAARQLPSGRWTSKLGQLEDIEHDLHALEDSDYGTVALIMRRPRRKTAPTNKDG